MINIRKARYEDVTILNSFLTLLIQDEKQYDDGINENFMVTNMYENYIEDDNTYLIVAEEKGQIVGYLFGKIKEGDETYHDSIACLDALYVLFDYRGQGIATSFIHAFKNWCTSKKIKKIEVNVCSKNLIAKQLYIREGFQTIKETLMIEN